MKLVKEAKISGKRIILRADLDVPLNEGKVGEDYRLRALLPTLKLILEKGADVLVIGHAGRPKGKGDPHLSLKPVAERLSRLLKKEIGFSEDIEGGRSDKGVVMLENLRFWPGEEKNEPAFAKKLAARGGLYVNEAFAASHRAHASISGVPRILPAYAGLRLAQEVEELGGVLKNPERPLVFILGGAKTETKSPLVPPLAKIADKVLLGGRLMFDKELEEIPRVVFPVDAVGVKDIGPKSIELFTSVIKEAKTVVWNGPLGVWEDHRYERGTKAIAEELALLPGKTIVGGGDLIAALSAFGLLEKMDYPSLGGGAMLEFLAGKELPGLFALGYY